MPIKSTGNGTVGGAQYQASPGKAKPKKAMQKIGTMSVTSPSPDTKTTRKSQSFVGKILNNLKKRTTSIFLNSYNLIIIQLCRLNY